MHSEPDNLQIQQCYEKYGALVFNRCRRFLGCDQDARDATQEIFMKLIDQWNHIRKRESVLFWLYRLCTNHCISLIRRRKFFVPLEVENEDIPSQIDIEKTAILRDLFKHLVMPWHKSIRLIVIYKYWDGYSEEEISKIMGLAPSTIRKHLTRFRKKSLKYIKRLEGEEKHGFCLLQ